MSRHYTEHDRTLPDAPDTAFNTPGYIPVSAIMISVADPDTGIPNIMPAVGWGFLNRHPLLLGVAVNTTDYNNDYYPRGTHPILKRTMDFAINIPTEDQRDIVTTCGQLSRHKDPSVDKFKEAGLTPGPGRRIKSPHIVECPINYECVVHGIYNMGSHDLFMGEVVGCFTEGEVMECVTAEGSDRITMKRPDGSVLSLTWSTMLQDSTD
jgi:flavin reductase (DIM6/NTAB) family NADH-FMN oxidoreductase RutF